MSISTTQNFTRLARLSGGDTLQALREEGLAQFQAKGLPTDKDEEWRFVNTDPLGEIAWQLPEGDLEAAELHREHTIAGSLELVLVNGRYSQKLSRLGGQPRGLFVGLLSEAAPEIAAQVRSLLASAAGVGKSPFVALNTGLLDQIVVIHARAGAMIELLVHVLSLSRSNGAPLLFSPRIVVVADEGASLRLVETHAGDADAPLLSNTVTEVFAATNAVVDHYHTNWMSAGSFGLTYTAAVLGSGAAYTHHNASLGGKLVRNDVEVVLNGERADATLNGLALLRDERQIDNHTLIRHEKPNCTSHELYKYVVGDRAFGVFKGKIYVQKDAQHTDSKQTSRTLLLTDQAMMESMPALEIYADDVKCTHGSTIGPLDEEMTFYLRSRGLSADAARHLLIYAFAADMTQRMKVLPIRHKIEQHLARQQDLPLDLSIEAM